VVLERSNIGIAGRIIHVDIPDRFVFLGLVVRVEIGGVDGRFANDNKGDSAGGVLPRRDCCCCCE